MTKAIRLHDYQNDIRRRLSEEWQHHRSVMIQMPTGTGKTHVLASLVSEECGVKNQRSAAEGKANEESGAVVVIVAHRRELVAQLEDTVERYGIKREDERVKVMSVQWLSRHWDDVEDVPELVIIDEAHHAVAETYRGMWDRWPKAKFLGLTATPCRMNRRGFSDLFDTLICSWSIAEFIEKRYLSAFDYVSIRPGSETQRLIDSLEKRGADGDYQVKEMNHVLNRDTSIERLYQSMEQFAKGKKGIVYAISIDHARKIAEYYSIRGVNAVPIDSRTPAVERKRMVEDFKAGRIKVLVNVDIFSEGFDCPDVEFVQMARPMLSLSKYLQQVGRGLRKSEGKETCVFIDNVGLYRVFGLPTVAWDWEAMFRGLMAGKAMQAANLRSHTGMTAIREGQVAEQEDGMEVVVSHEQLLVDIGKLKNVRPMQADNGELRAWQDRESGLWGLRRVRSRTTEAVFLAVFDTKYDMAAVMFRDKDCGIVNKSGDIVLKKKSCLYMKFLRNSILSITLPGDIKNYVDLHGMHTYLEMPEVKRYGNIELLKTGPIYHSRTKKKYVNNQSIDDSFISVRKFYISIYDHKVPPFGLDEEETFSYYRCGFACIMEGDYNSYYWIYRALKDESIIVADDDGNFYHASAEGMRYVGCRSSAEERKKCKARIARMTDRAERLRHSSDFETKKARRQFLGRQEEARPFRSGQKWGLMVGGRITIPPVYRNVRSPVGKYCAVEKNYCQWGVVALDGTMMVEPLYADIEISTQGIVTGTKVTGNKVAVKLP